MAQRKLTRLQYSLLLLLMQHTAPSYRGPCPDGSLAKEAESDLS